MAKSPPRLPTKSEILEFVKTTDGVVGKREIARAFHIKGQDKIALKALLKEMQDEGSLSKGRAKRFDKPGQLPEFTVLSIDRLTEDGDLLARPVSWTGENPPPPITVKESKHIKPALGLGDRFLAKLSKQGHGYLANPVRRLGKDRAALMGVLERVDGEMRLKPSDVREKNDYVIAEADLNGGVEDDLVLAEGQPGRHLGLRRARVTDVLGSISGPKSLSLISIHAQGIPHRFSEEAQTQADEAQAAPLGNRVDLRNTPLVTIDGADARDFDDAVFAEPDEDPKNKGGWHLIVAIADVSWYVRPGDALDRTAFERGNSVYFPDRVVPMLPEALSNGWCSLKPKEDRPCLAAHMWIDKQGKLLRWEFVRGLMRSQARLTYEQVQAAVDGAADDLTDPLLEGVLKPLYGAYKVLSAARAKRGALELDLPERKIDLDEAGNILTIKPRARLDSHKLIEEFMITANVAAAEALAPTRWPAMLRIHDDPDEDALDGLREALFPLDIKVSKGRTTIQHLNGIIAKVRGTAHENMVNMLILRAQAQAIYGPEDKGHFGLGLRRYAHFTSPIRRYADLMVHRALIAALDLGDGGWTDKSLPNFQEVGEHISQTERRAASAERDCYDRYVAKHLTGQVGARFSGVVSGVNRAGLFITLDETGADGLIPMRSLPSDYYHVDRDRHSLLGANSGLEFSLGMKLEVTLQSANPIAGALNFDLSEWPEAARSQRPGPRRKTSTRRRGNGGSRRSRRR